MHHIAITRLCPYSAIQRKRERKKERERERGGEKERNEPSENDEAPLTFLSRLFKYSQI
jgi:hypothetical protein